MSFWSKVQEQTSERLKQSREQLSAAIARNSPVKPNAGSEALEPAESKLGERTHSEAYNFFDGDYEARNAVAKQHQLQQDRERSELARLQQANRLLEAKIEMLRSNLEVARASKPEEGSGDEIQQLQSDLALARRQTCQLQQTCDLLKEQQASAVTSAAASEEQVQRLDSELTAARNEVAELRKANGQIQTQMQQFRSAERAPSQPEADGQEAAELRQQCQQLTKQLSAAITELQDARQLSKDWKAKSAALNSSHSKQVSQQAAELDNLKVQNIHLQTQVSQFSSLKEYTDQLTTRNEQQAADAEHQQQKILHMEQHSRRLEEQVASLKRRANTAEEVAHHARETAAATAMAEQTGKSQGSVGNGSSRTQAIATTASQEVSSPTGLTLAYSELQSDSARGTSSPTKKDAASLAQEVKQLKAQLQMATEKWARDKLIFAEDARELQRVSRLKDQLGSQVAVLRAQVEQHQDMSSELVEAKQELLTTAAELADAQSQAAAYQQLQDLLEGWDIPGDRAADNGNLIKQLSTRKSAMSALSHKLEATSAAAADAHKDLETAAVRLDGALIELAKEREEKERLLQVAAEAQSQLQDVQAMRSSLLQQLDTATSASQQALSRLEGMEGELQQVRHLSSQQAQQILSMSASLSAAQADATGTEDELNAQLEQARAESQRAQSREAELLRRINDLTARLDTEQTGFRAEREKLEQELKSTRAESQDGRQRLADQQRAANELKEKVRGLQFQLDAAHSQAAASQEALEQQQAELQAVQQSAAGLKQQVEVLNQRVRDIPSQLDSAASDKAEDAKRLAASQTQLADAQSLSDSRIAQNDQLTIEVQRLLAELKHTCAAAEEAQEQLASRNTDLSQQFESLQAELASAISHHSASERSQLQELQGVQGQLLQAEQDRARHAQDLETCQQELQNAKQESEAANSAAKTLQGQLQQAVQSLAEMSTQTLETQQLQAQLAAAEDEILRLKEALHHKQQEAAAPSSVPIAGNENHLQQQGEGLQREAAVQLDSLQSGLAHSEENRLHVSNTAEARESRHEAEITGLQSQLRGLHAELDHAAANSQSQEHEAIAQLTSQIADLQSRLEQATSASMLVADLQQERDAVLLEAQQLQSELTQSRSSIQATQRALAEQSEAAQAAHTAAQGAAEEAVQAVKRAEQLQQEKELLQVQVQALDEAWQAERVGLKDKLERLQKVNRQRRQEAEDMQAELASAQEMAAKGQQAREELLDARQRMEALSSRLAAAEQAAAEASILTGELRESEARQTAAAADVQQESLQLQASLTAAEHERDQALQEVAMLRSAAVANDALQAQVSALTRDLEAARESVLEAQRGHKRAEDAEQRLRQTQADAAQVAQLLAQAQQKQQVAEQQAQAAAEDVEKERTQRAAEAQAFLAEMEGLAARELSSWPPALRILCQQREASAAEAAAAAVRAEMDAAEERLEAELKVAQDEAHIAAEQRQAAIAARQAVEARVGNLEAELRAREATLSSRLSEQLHQERGASEARLQAVEERAARAEEALESREAAAAEARATCEAAGKELAEVKQRARALLEEKDAQLQAARARTMLRAGSLGDPSSPLPVSTLGASGDIFTPRTEDHDQSTELTPMLSASVPSGQLQSATPLESRPSEIEPALEAPGVKPLPRSNRIQALQERIALLERELQDSESTHKLRDRAQEVAKAEIGELQRSKAREGLDADYLKAVLLKGFESGELPRTSSMLPVLARLLHFSQDELHRAQTPRKAAKSAGRK